ncbi:MAG: ArsR/SmtB family transcription factor [Brevinema sp.]
MNDMVSVYRALADRSRLRILHALTNQELCACQIIALLAVSGATVSQHMNVLVQAGLVHSQKSGRWMYYKRLEHDLSPSFEQLRQQFYSDQALLDDILSQNLEDITRGQRHTCVDSDTTEHQ